MITFAQLRENLEEDIVDILKSIGVSSLEIDYDEGYISGEFETKAQVQAAVDRIPDNVDYDIEVMIDVGDGETVDVDSGEEDEIDFSELDDSIHSYEIYVYLDNAEIEDEMDDEYYDEDEMDENTSLDERKRIIKVNAKGKRRIKIKCNKGFKFDGKKCVKIGGTEAIKKRKAIRKAVRTKKAKGAGAVRKANRLRKRARLKRKSMGLK